MHKVTKLFVALLAISAGGSASALQWSFNGDLNNRFGLYTDQALMFNGSETVATTSGAPTSGPYLQVPGTVVSNREIREAWADLKYRLGIIAATEDQKIKGVITFEWGSIRFGSNPSLGCTVTGAAPATTGGTVACTTGGSVAKNAGGGFSGDGVQTELRFAYLDFALPAPGSHRLTVGLQPYTGGNKWLWQETATGVQIKGAPGGPLPFGYTVAWMRGVEFVNTRSADAFFASADGLLARLDFVPMKNVKFGVFDQYEHRNPQAAPAAANRFTFTAKKNWGPVNYNIHNVGLDGSVTAGPVFFNLDAIYQVGTIAQSGLVTGTTFRRQGLDLNAFFAHADLGVNVGPVKVTYTGWYSSGDTNPNDKKVRNFVETDMDASDSVIFFEGGLTDDNYLTEAPYFLDKGAIFNKLAVDYKVTPKLTVGVAGMYVMTAEELTIGPGVSGLDSLGGRTSAASRAATATKTRNLGLEFDGSIAYRIYDGLEAALNFGYLFAGDGMDAFEVVKNGKKDHDVFRGTGRIRYQF